MKDHEAHDDRLDEKEDGVEFVVTLIAYDCSGHEAGEVKNAADGVFRCDCAIPGADDLPGCTRALTQGRELHIGSRFVKCPAMKRTFLHVDLLFDFRAGRFMCRKW